MMGQDGSCFRVIYGTLLLGQLSSRYVGDTAVIGQLTRWRYVVIGQVANYNVGGNVCMRSLVS